MLRKQNLIHPGEILSEEFGKPMNISQNKLALDIHVPAPRINAIIRGTLAITADTALRLGKYFGTGLEFWWRLHYLNRCADLR
jgi:addiction module HigA family antidote